MVKLLLSLWRSQRYLTYVVQSPFACEHGGIQGYTNVILTYNHIRRSDLMDFFFQPCNYETEVGQIIQNM